MLKFSKIDRIRPLAENKVDEFFAGRINAILGPMAALHSRKRLLALSGLIEDGEAVLAKATEQDAAILALDRERRALKVLIRAATNSDEIFAAMEQLR